MEPFSAVPATITAHGLDNTVLRELERVRVGVFTLDPEQAQVGLALHHVRGAGLAHMVRRRWSISR